MDVNERISIKLAQVAIGKFNQSIPQYLKVLRNHKCNIEKAGSLNDWETVKREQINAARAIKQLKFLILEIDKVRMKVKESEQQQFNELIEETRKNTYNGMAEYLASQQKLQSKAVISSVYQEHHRLDEGGEGTEYVADKQLSFIPSIVTTYNSKEQELKHREECLKEMEHLQKEVQDIQALYQTVHTMTYGQGEAVLQVENNVMAAQIEITAGEVALRKALSYKKAVYPIFGAILGSCIGGPVGLAVGLKAGGLAALGGGLVGFAGGRFIKNVDNVSMDNDTWDSGDNASEAIEYEEASTNVNPKTKTI